VEFSDLCLLEEAGISVIEVPEDLKQEPSGRLIEYIEVELEAVSALSDYASYADDMAEALRDAAWLTNAPDLTLEQSEELLAGFAGRSAGDVSR
jgi:hypothetical protein